MSPNRLGWITVLALIPFFSGCSSAPTTTEFKPDRVVGRMDELDSRPNWVTESTSVQEKDGKLHFIGVSEVPGDSRVQAAFKMSDASARGYVANKIETSVLKVVESSDTGLSMEDQSLQSLIQEVSKTSLKNIDVKSRYWEKVARTSSTGSESLVLKTFSLIEIPTQEMKNLLTAAVASPKTQVKSDLRNRVKTAIDSGWGAEDL